MGSACVPAWLVNEALPSGTAGPDLEEPLEKTFLLAVLRARLRTCRWASAVARRPRRGICRRRRAVRTIAARA